MIKVLIMSEAHTILHNLTWVWGIYYYHRSSFTENGVEIMFYAISKQQKKILFFLSTLQFHYKNKNKKSSAIKRTASTE